MNSAINTYAFNQNPVESAALGVLGFTLHQIKTAGDYVGTVLQNGNYVGKFWIAVVDKDRATQADIDLSTFAPAPTVTNECCDGAAASSNGTTATPALQLGAGGYAVLYASNGAGNYQVTIDEKNADGSLKAVFDSTTLNTDDMFVVTLIRPGRYRIDDTVTGASTHATVAYPPDPDGPFVQPQAISIDVTNTISQSELQLLPTQGMIFNMKSDGHAISVSLETPDDGPGAQSIRWNNPAEG